ncbi:ABC transporter substrate-binding protein [Streptomyces sp. JJ36]|uniref:ABC transporter substrate-binding protein n=1 Tax=Streptomyces sp. JJ36 TaxID=2736645 RepID=UPI001F31E4E1|nr:ABC transporter substrate-binding protein [Streptomyces sp. JJ36]MCF6524341.1 peptide-binding protein [Streptomyces sp. JJ36]
MFDRNGLRITATVLITVLLAGCSVLSGDDSDEEQSIVVGTTSAPSVLDPAGAWDQSWELFRNVYQTLLHFPNSSSSPEPEAAKRCQFTDSASKVYRCTLREGLTFSNGNPLDARAVKYSLDRVLTIDAETGPAGLMGSLDRIETPAKNTVVFHLKKSDATFPYVLATPAGSIVDPETYPADTLLEGEKIAGSGPYTLEKYKANEIAVLKRNPDYQGAADIKNDSVTIDYFKSSRKMVAAFKRNELDITFRGLTPAQISDFQDATAEGNDNVELSEVVGTEIRYLVFNPKFDNAGNEAVRKAIAQLIDRKALVRNVYNRTAEPLYSMVPAGLTGHTNAFFDVYGEPSRSKAESLLRNAGFEEPVPLTLWYTTDRYGSTMQKEFEEIERQLEGSGLFEISVKGRPWNEFQEGYLNGEYPVFGRGWFPDFPDADNYVTPFVGEKNALGTPYESATLTEELLPQSRRESDRGVAGHSFTKAQKIFAEDARLLPLWQGKVYVASHTDIAGVEWCIDPSTIMRMWELHKKASW